MILLLDAHTLLWALVDDGTLRRDARAAIADPANDVLVSAATVWELAIKRQLGKLDAPVDLGAAVIALKFIGLPITLADGESAASLPRHHGDPFDRMLVAQARRLGAVVVTRDPTFALYGVEVLPA
jgi:PIN domain nuclease of toxin-antitoxin system